MKYFIWHTVSSDIIFLVILCILMVSRSAFYHTANSHRCGAKNTLKLLYNLFLFQVTVKVAAFHVIQYTGHNNIAKCEIRCIWNLKTYHVLCLLLCCMRVKCNNYFDILDMMLQYAPEYTSYWFCFSGEHGLMQGIITLQQRDFYKIKLKQEIDGIPGRAIGNSSLEVSRPP